MSINLTTIVMLSEVFKTVINLDIRRWFKSHKAVTYNFN